VPATDRYVVFSADTHGGTPAAGYRDYLDPEYREEFDAWLPAFDRAVHGYREAMDTRLRSRGQTEESIEAFHQNMLLGLTDGQTRLKFLETDGCVGGVVFAATDIDTLPPFNESRSWATSATHSIGNTCGPERLRTTDGWPTSVRPIPVASPELPSYPTSMMSTMPSSSSSGLLVRDCAAASPCPRTTASIRFPTTIRATTGSGPRASTVEWSSTSMWELLGRPEALRIRATSGGDDDG
jgi:hypothetical protein